MWSLFVFTVSVDSSKKTRISAVLIELPTLFDRSELAMRIHQSDRLNNNRIVLSSRDSTNQIALNPTYSQSKARLLEHRDTYARQISNLPQFVCIDIISENMTHP